MPTTLRIGSLFLGLTAVLAICTGCPSGGEPGKPAAVPANGEKPAATASGTKGEVIIDGSSSVYPITEAAKEAFGKENQSVSVSAGYSGTGGGMKKFIRKEIDICDASRPIKAEEIENCKKAEIKFIELPIAFDALTIAVPKENTWATDMTVEELKKMWSPESQGKITKWSEIREGWPDEAFSLFGADADSGTFEYFTEAINGKAKATRKDFSPNPNDNLLVQGIAGNKFALGYIPYTYFEPNQDKLRAVAIKKDADAEAVLPSIENALEGKYVPLSRPLFIYVNQASAQRPEVKEFVQFYLKNGKQFAEAARYMPLGDEAYTKALERFDGGKTGSIFGGKNAVGLTAKELLERELQE